MEVDGLIFNKSKVKNKKYSVVIPASKWNKYHPNDKVKTKKTINFGDKRYEHYEDKIGLYSKLDHRDKDRRQRYFDRHSKTLNKDGEPAYLVKYSPG